MQWRFALSVELSRDPRVLGAGVAQNTHRGFRIGWCPGSVTPQLCDLKPVLPLSEPCFL